MRRLLTIAGVALLALALAAPVSADAPTLTVSQPANGATLSGTSVVVDYQITNFALLKPPVPASEAGKHPEVNKPNQGHIHLTLDLQPVVMEFGPSTYTLANVPPGPHVLVAELVNNDHSPLSPPVTQRISFTTVPGSLPSTGDGGTAGNVWGPLALSLLGLAALGFSGAALRRRRA